MLHSDFKQEKEKRNHENTKLACRLSGGLAAVNLAGYENTKEEGFSW